MKDLIKKETKSLSYNSNVVAGFWIEGEPSWFHCRDTFSSKFTQNTAGFYFSTDERDLQKRKLTKAGYHVIEHVPYFFEKFENIAGIPEEEKTVFSKTPRQLVIWVEPQNFWKSCPVRRSLFTILLRCGLLYNKDSDNFDEAVYSDDYAKKTTLALQRFMFGFTENQINFNGNFSGWLNHFLDKTPAQISSMLVNKSHKTEFPMLSKVSKTHNVPMIWD